MTKQLIWTTLTALLLSSAALAAAVPDPLPQAQHDHQNHVVPGLGDAWTSAPLLNKAPGRSRSVALLKVQGMQAAAMQALPASEQDEGRLAIEVPLQDGKGAVRARGARQGGWYRVIADSADGLSRAGTVVYFSNPGPAPRHMLQAVQPGLDLSPQKLPREHWKFRANETWPFTLRRDGQPLADQVVLFETASGQRQQLRTDAHGVLQLTFPDDFRDPAVAPAGHAGHGRQPSTEFVLSVQLTRADGASETAAFNYKYYPGPFNGKSLWLGGGFALLGMVFALPLVIRREARGGVA